MTCTQGENRTNTVVIVDGHVIANVNQSKRDRRCQKRILHSKPQRNGDKSVILMSVEWLATKFIQANFYWRKIILKFKKPFFFSPKARLWY